MIDSLLKSCNLSIQNLTIEKESQEYGACEFEIDKKRIKFRAAKITPTKIGQFVTIWKRIGSGPIMPFDAADLIDFFVISVCGSNQLGLFIFPKAVLVEKGYVSVDGKGGKRAMRVYPPWDTVDNPTAQKTQKWQILYFVAMNTQLPMDNAKVQMLLL